MRRTQQISDNLFIQTTGDGSFCLSQNRDFAFQKEQTPLQRKASIFKSVQRRYVPDSLSYIILIPTLRCNLSCSYCQVSRASEHATGYDWTPKIQKDLKRFLSGLETETLKVEFQGGEPLLRIDFLKQIREFCRKRFRSVEFVVCTNLQSLTPDHWQFLSSPDTKISTSFDGTWSEHEKQRTQKHQLTNEFQENLKRALREFGTDKISALPTLDAKSPPDPQDVIRNFLDLGIQSIYLRPVNHLGFARKKHNARSTAEDWNSYYRNFVDRIIEHNFRSNTYLEEFYFSHCFRRVLSGMYNGHVDLRNPNTLGKDYLVVDYDGTFFPTDEARMLARTGILDLSIGTLEHGIDHEKLSALNAHNSNDADPRCQECAFQPYCGRDVIDDISRYGRIDIERQETEFCKRHLSIFNYIFELLARRDPIVDHSLAIWAGVPRIDEIVRNIQ